LRAFKLLLARIVKRLLLILKAVATPVAFGACALVTDPEGRVLLVRHSYQPGWHFPGGGVAAGEPPAEGVMRELKEEIGLVSSDPPELIGLFTRKLGWVTNLVALYRVRNAEIAFKPSLEIRELFRAEADSPPPGTVLGARRRLAELAGEVPVSAYW
jgi:ADP-ribose pyrophosphatase YjhB (NUDIX family)